MFKRFIVQERGLTLLEIMVTVVILGIVSVTVFPALGTMYWNSNEDDVKTQAAQLARDKLEEIRQYLLDNVQSSAQLTTYQTSLNNTAATTVPLQSAKNGVVQNFKVKAYMLAAASLPNGSTIESQASFGTTWACGTKPDAQTLTLVRNYPASPLTYPAPANYITYQYLLVTVCRQ